MFKSPRNSLVVCGHLLLTNVIWDIILLSCLNIMFSHIMVEDVSRVELKEHKYLNIQLILQYLPLTLTFFP